MSTRYRVVSAYSLAEFSDLVTQHLDRGWVTQGGVAVVHDSPVAPLQLFQAMTKEITDVSDEPA